MKPLAGSILNTEAITTLKAARDILRSLAGPGWENAPATCMTDAGAYLMAAHRSTVADALSALDAVIEDLA